METLTKMFEQRLEKWEKGGSLLLFYALLIELLVMGYVAFLGLFTLETLLPTFVTVRLSLVKFLFWLILLTYLAATLGERLGLGFPFRLTKKSPLLWLGALWLAGILAVSLMKFPLWAIALLIAGFFLTLYLLAGFFFDSEEKG